MRTLILIPTQSERAKLIDAGYDGDLHVCGLGPVDAAVGAMACLTAHAYDRCLLVGLCGSFSTEQLPIGEAFVGTTFELPGLNANLATMLNRPLTLKPTWKLDLPQTCSGGMLTVHAASENLAMAKQRHNDFSHCLAEDMETFAVALAARQVGVPFACVRGACNVVGDRDHAHWQMDLAMQALCQAMKVAVGA